MCSNTGVHVSDHPRKTNIQAALYRNYRHSHMLLPVCTLLVNLDILSNTVLGGDTRIRNGRVFELVPCNKRHDSRAEDKECQRPRHFCRDSDCPRFNQRPSVPNSSTDYIARRGVAERCQGGRACFQLSTQEAPQHLGGQQLFHFG